MREVGNFPAARAYAPPPPKPAQGAALSFRARARRGVYATKPTQGPGVRREGPDGRLAPRGNREARGETRRRRRVAKAASAAAAL